VVEPARDALAKLSPDLVYRCSRNRSLHDALDEAIAKARQRLNACAPRRPRGIAADVSCRASGRTQAIARACALSMTDSRSAVHRKPEQERPVPEERDGGFHPAVAHRFVSPWQ
jgi:hypothetical protein